MPIRILIADDHGLIRAGLRALLEAVPDLEIVGEAEDGAAAVQLALELQPDIILMDISMGGEGGIEATRRVRDLSPRSWVLALTVHEDETMLREMIQAGASGYLIKRAVESDLIDAIRVVSKGDIYVYPALTRALLRDLSVQADRPDEFQKEIITPRETKVLVLLARGYTNRQIAEELNLSQRTVEGYRSSLVSKLGISSRVELLNFAEQHGLLKSKN